MSTGYQPTERPLLNLEEATGQGREEILMKWIYISTKRGDMIERSTRGVGDREDIFSLGYNVCFDQQ